MNIPKICETSSPALPVGLAYRLSLTCALDLLCYDASE